MHILLKLFELPLYFISGFFRKKEIVIFGAWNGNKYGDNSAYLLEYLKNKNIAYELIWIGNSNVQNSVPADVSFIEKDSYKAFKKLIKAKHIFITHSISDVSTINIFRNADVIQLWHGVGIKSLDTIQEQGLFSKLRSLFRKTLRNYDYFVASSRANARRTIDVFNTYGANKNNIIETGFPRNDFFFKKSYRTKIISEIISNQLNVNVQKKLIILYMPTFRTEQEERFSFLDLDVINKNKLEIMLKNSNAILLEKAHDSESISNKQNCNHQVSSIYPIFTNIDMDVQDLLVVSDLLITDYSSVYLDFVMLDRPIIHYTYDYDKYVNQDNGIYYDFDQIAGGDVVVDFDNLLDSIQLNLEKKELNQDLRGQAKKHMLEFEQGKSCENIGKYFELIMEEEIDE